MPEETKRSELRSELKLVNRSALSISGLERVIAANESRVNIVVGGCMLNILGVGMRVERLDVAGGFIDIAGQINELKYTDSRDKTNFFKRLVK